MDQTGTIDAVPEGAFTYEWMSEEGYDDNQIFQVRLNGELFCEGYGPDRETAKNRAMNAVTAELMSVTS